eukprot:TRINITY_DN15111_c0_g2_i1.p1 TRINITY_DN15111_c0_g2~~TRINITY_DN15111_c0_g2_i1.p1  ORF type:complete len:105 (-),score=21.15 TRINITY_DN15111_c0_g2_i1:110-424(-)
MLLQLDLPLVLLLGCYICFDDGSFTHLCLLCVRRGKPSKHSIVRNFNTSRSGSGSSGISSRVATTTQATSSASAAPAAARPPIPSALSAALAHAAKTVLLKLKV